MVYTGLTKYFVQPLLIYIFTNFKLLQLNIFNNVLQNKITLVICPKVDKFSKQLSDYPIKHVYLYIFNYLLALHAQSIFLLFMINKYSK